MPVSFNNIPSGIRVPLFYAEVDNSAASTTAGQNKAVLIGRMLTGTAAAIDPVVVTSAAQAAALFGRGSQIARMVAAYRRSDPMGELWAVGMTDASSTAAVAQLSVQGVATESGVVSIYVSGTRTQTQISSSDTAQMIATHIAATINGLPDLPVSAAASSSVVQLTSKNKGAEFNDLRVGVNLAGAAAGEVLPYGVSVTATAFSGGSGNPDVASALAALGEEPFEFIGISTADVSTLDAIRDAMQDTSGRWSYLRQLYGHAVVAKRGDEQTLIDLGKTRNDQHCSIVGVEPGQQADPAEIAAAVLGRTAVYITNDPARPLQTGELVGIPAPKISDSFSMAARQALLSNGIATLYQSGGVVRIERLITTYRVNAFGIADNSYLDACTPFTLSYIIRYLRGIITSKYARHKLASDGTRYGAGQAVVTPSVIRGELIAAYRRLEYNAIVENAELFAQHLIVERNAQDPNRLDVLLPPDLVNQLRVFAMLVQFRLQYEEEL